MKVDIYNQKGEKKGQVDLNKEIFDIPFNEDLVHQALVRQQANMRIAVAHTKKRGEVRGGGRKPYRQKGTGNARQGSTRNVHYRGGCVVFGPRNDRNFSKQMPKKQRRKALFSALSEKARTKEVIGLENYETKEIKTKTFNEMLQKLPIQRNVLIVVPEKNETIERSAKNLPNAKTILVNYLNIADIQKYKTVMFLKESFNKMEEIFLTKK